MLLSYEKNNEMLKGVLLIKYCFFYKIVNFVEDCIIKSYMYVFLIKILIIIKNNFFNKDGIILYIYLCVYYFSLVKIFNIF